VPTAMVKSPGVAVVVHFQRDRSFGVPGELT
jgi:hypothetical protein